MNIASRTALVTGAGSGIGRVVALALAADGWTVHITGRRIATLQETAAMGPRGRIWPFAADIADESSVDALFTSIAARSGRLDLLFNNAGVNVSKVPLDELSSEELRSIIDTNVWGAMLCARAAIRQMKDQKPCGGRIINNGSVSAYGPRLNTAAYTTTKHAITGLTKSLALEGRSSNIVCGQIDIGNAAVERTEYVQFGTAQADGTIAAEPRIDASHVGEAVCHMARLPLEANIPFMTLMASAMPLYGRG